MYTCTFIFLYIFVSFVHFFASLIKILITLYNVRNIISRFLSQIYVSFNVFILPLQFSTSLTISQNDQIKRLSREIVNEQREQPNIIKCTFIRSIKLNKN